MLKKIKVSIESEQVVEVISEAKAALTSAILHYGFLTVNETTIRCKAKEEEAIIDGSKSRLKRMGLDKEEIDKIDWSLDPNIILFYKDWCKDNNRKFSDLASMNSFLEQRGVQS